MGKGVERKDDRVRQMGRRHSRTRGSDVEREVLRVFNFMIRGLVSPC